jgi:hypothetical protein
MGDQNGRRAAPFPKLGQIGVKTCTRQFIYGAEGLIEKQQSWLTHKAASNRYALAHTARQFGRSAAFEPT